MCCPVVMEGHAELPMEAVEIKAHFFPSRWIQVRKPWPLLPAPAKPCNQGHLPVKQSGHKASDQWILVRAHKNVLISFKINRKKNVIIMDG